MTAYQLALPLVSPSHVLGSPRLWIVGSYRPSGKLRDVFYLYHHHTMKRAVDKANRLRKFGTRIAAERAALKLEHAN